MSIKSIDKPIDTAPVIALLQTRAEALRPSKSLSKYTIVDDPDIRAFPEMTKEDFLKILASYAYPHSLLEVRFSSFSALHYATFCRREDYVDAVLNLPGGMKLLNRGIYESGKTPIAFATSICFSIADRMYPIIEKLLSFQADLNRTSAYGETPLQIAVKAHKLVLATRFLKLGGTIAVKNGKVDGLTDEETCWLAACRQKIVQEFEVEVDGLNLVPKDLCTLILSYLL